jgi:hypothetical protein
MGKAINLIKELETEYATHLKVGKGNDLIASLKLTIGLVNICVDQMTFRKIKNYLKEAILQTESLKLKGIILANLGIINYIEIQLHN